MKVIAENAAAGLLKCNDELLVTSAAFQHNAASFFLIQGKQK